jgi:DMSO/TMAO reductase YedYZ molybdopterin-dependent catalytic subunit
MTPSESKGRLPPGQSLTSGFPVLRQGRIPEFNPSTWDFRVWGAVEHPVTFTWDQLLALPRRSVRLDLHCVTGWSKFGTQWEGISLKTLIDEGWVTPKPEAQFILQHAEHGYTTNLSLQIALQDNFLLATHYNGQPLTPEHGYPLRAVIGSIPERRDLKDLYLWKGAKWLRGLEFLAHDQLGYWESIGYHNEGDVWKEQRRSRGSGFSP